MPQIQTTSYNQVIQNLKENYPLDSLNTFGISVSARYFLELNSQEELALLPEILFALGNPKLLVLGGGSNVLLTQDWEGLVLKNAIRGVEKEFENAEEVIFSFGAGEEWHQVVMFTLAEGLSGIENLALIPGSIGAAPMQNIGAYGVEIKDVFHSLTAFDLETEKFVEFDSEACAFGYRESYFKREGKNRFIICSVALRLSKKFIPHVAYGAIKDTLAQKGISVPEKPIQVAEAVIEIRQSKLPDPKVIGNAGSFFKNPEIPLSLYESLKAVYSEIPHYAVANPEMVKVPAGWLIEKAGWKGFRDGEIGVHAKQALVLVNYGKGSGEELWNLALKIQADIFEKFGIEIIPEVNKF